MDQYTARLFQIESGGNPFAVTGSNRGLGQFGPDEERMYGLNDANRADPDAQAAAVARERAYQTGVLRNKLGRDPTPGELYLTHQQGIAGGPALLTSDPSTPAWAAIRPYYHSDAIALKAIGGNIPRGSPLYGMDPSRITAGDFSRFWTNKFEKPGSASATAYADEQPSMASAPAQGAISAAMKGNTAMPQNPFFGGDNSGGSTANSGGGFNFGDALQSIGAGLMAPYNPKVAASLWKDQATKAALAKSKFGLTPVWAQDDQGNYVPMQMNSAGGIQPLPLPGNLKAVLPTTQVNMGGMGTGILPRGATAPTNIIPKSGPIGTDEQPVQGPFGPTGAYEAVPGSQTAGKITPREIKTQGLDRLDYNLGKLTEKYTALHDNAGIAGPSNSVGDTLKNAEAYGSSSGVGQVLGRLFGTQNQSTRNEINGLRASLINSIRQTTGMSARAMDSDAELKFYMQQATDPQNDYLSNLAAIDNLDKQYGQGNVLQRKLPPAIYKQVQQRSEAMRAERQNSAGSEDQPQQAPAGLPEGVSIRRIK